ncbi:rCG27385 [Rattus norvegicus]|uniref:RCG27385 n=1 Tax=Rattus norvegicus TaxID=10116 RepID=A6HQL1_RAT|nr:rCG27385 [Rattus norvegicus]
MASYVPVLFLYTGKTCTQFYVLKLHSSTHTDPHTREVGRGTLLVVLILGFRNQGGNLQRLSQSSVLPIHRALLSLHCEG